jgi:hypothetical protein
MSWDAVEAICKEHNIFFNELPVAGIGFHSQLARVSRKDTEFVSHNNPEAL